MSIKDAIRSTRFLPYWIIYPVLFILIIFITSRGVWNYIDFINPLVDPKDFWLNLSETDPDKSKYILGLLIQIEASILAVFFTLSLVVVQLAASSYSARVIDLFKRTPDFWILASFYIIFIIFKIIILKFIYDPNLGDYMLLSYQADFFALLALIPYLWNMLDLLKPSKIINILSNEISKESILSTIRVGDENDPIQPTMDVIVNSIIKYDDGTFLHGLRAIESRMNHIFKNNNIESHQEFAISKIIFSHLSLIIVLLSNRKDDSAVVQAIYCMGRIGSAAAKHKLEIIATEATQYLEEFGVKAAQQKHERTVIEASSSIGAIAINATENKLVGAAELASIRLSTIGVEAVDQRLENALSQVISSLGRIGIKVIEEDLDSASFEVVTSLRTIGVIAAEQDCINAIRSIKSNLELLLEIASNYGRNQVKSHCMSAISEIEERTIGEHISSKSNIIRATLDPIPRYIISLNIK